MSMLLVLVFLVPESPGIELIKLTRPIAHVSSKVAGYLAFVVRGGLRGRFVNGSARRRGVTNVG
jgi:hypothetical protein